MSVESPVRLVRYGELKPCKTAFIDAHTPGSDRKENFTIIGAGVTESPDQHVHIRETPGFNIGAAGQPPGCKNSLHYHNTAEVFFVLKGRWKFFWGLHGDDGEVTLEEGDIFNIPTKIFRGFENTGTDYGMIMSILGGDDAGGGVVWAPHVLEKAEEHGLVLGENGVLYDSKLGESLPHNVSAMPHLTTAELAECPVVPVSGVVRDFIARYQDLVALASDGPCKVIGPNALLRDRPGFEVDFITRNSLNRNPNEAPPMHEVLMVQHGHWRLQCGNQEFILGPGDTALIEPGHTRTLQPAMEGEAALFRVRRTDDPAGHSLIWQEAS